VAEAEAEERPSQSPHTSGVLPRLTFFLHYSTRALVLFNRSGQRWCKKIKH
jgi:hypothetical protein